MKKGKPLSVRLYFQPPLYELARAIGYRGLPLSEAREQMKRLVERFGREAMEAAAREVVRIDPSTDPPTARLTEAARKACGQLLGPPPEPALQTAGPYPLPQPALPAGPNQP
jgi:hypothetical protein